MDNDTISLLEEVKIPEREKYILTLRFKHNCTYREIANYCSFSHQRGRQIVEKALRRLKDPKRVREMMGVYPIHTRKENE